MNPNWTTSNRSGRGFTLVELLVVIGIIGVLIAILLPTIRRVREQSEQVVCASNLKQIGIALVAYAQDNRDHFPNDTGLGKWTYRRQPGMKNPADPTSFPEWMGLPAVLHGIRVNDFKSTMPVPQIQSKLDLILQGKGRYLSAISKVWLCPSASDQWYEFRNTYGWSMAMGNYSPAQRSSRRSIEVGTRRAPLLWDNTNARPWLPGIMANTSAGFVVKTDEPLVFPHRAPAYGREGTSVNTAGWSSKNGKHGVNELHMDGSVVCVFYANGDVTPG